MPAITGFAKALEIAQKQKKTQTKKITAIRDNMIKNLLQKIPSAKLNGPKTQRLANNINISIKGIDGDAIVSALDEQGILASTGSACTNSKIEQSHVLLAIGLDEETAMGTIRLTLGKQTTQKDAQKICTALPKIVTELQKNKPQDLSAEEIIDYAQDKRKK